MSDVVKDLGYSPKKNRHLETFQEIVHPKPSTKTTSVEPEKGQTKTGTALRALPKKNGKSKFLRLQISIWRLRRGVPTGVCQVRLQRHLQRLPQGLWMSCGRRMSWGYPSFLLGKTQDDLGVSLFKEISIYIYIHIYIYIVGAKPNTGSCSLFQTFLILSKDPWSTQFQMIHAHRSESTFCYGSKRRHETRSYRPRGPTLSPQLEC